MTGRSEPSAAATLAPYVFFGLLPALLWYGLITDINDRGALAYDFHNFFYPQARVLLDGGVPQTAYPPLTTAFYAPFALLGRDVGDVVVTVFMVACAAGTLLVMGVRDWRCYGAAALWLPVWASVQTANLSLVLTLCVAIMWRLKDRPLPSGGLVAFMVASKLFLWPMLLWLVATRRWRSAGVTVGLGVAASAAAFALVGLDRVTKLPSLLSGNVQDNDSKPYTIPAVVQQLGASADLGYALCWAAGAVVLLLAIRAGLRGREAASLTLFVGAAVLLSPIVWSHYLALLLVPVALARPRFSRLWLLPLPLWVCPAVDAPLPQKILYLGIGAAVITICARELLRDRPPALAA